MARKKKTEPATESNGVALMDAPDDASSPATEPATDRAGNLTLDATDVATGPLGALDHIADAGKVIDEEAEAAKEWQANVIEMTREVQLLHEKAEEDKKRATASKKRWESASEELHEYILKAPESLPLIDGAEARSAAIEAPKPVEAKEDEAWRNDPISVLDLPESLTEKLSDNGFRTIGHLADWSTKGNHLTDIPGVGAVTAEKIEEALTVYWHAFTTTPPAKVEAPGNRHFKLVALTSQGDVQSLGIFTGTLAQAEARADDIEAEQGIEVDVIDLAVQAESDFEAE
jgi:hypothetical protein